MWSTMSKNQYIWIVLRTYDIIIEWNRYIFSRQGSQNHFVFCVLKFRSDGTNTNNIYNFAEYSSFIVCPIINKLLHVHKIVKYIV